jgi:hypothetical protein
MISDFRKEKFLALERDRAFGLETPREFRFSKNVRFAAAGRVDRRNRTDLPDAPGESVG